MSLQRHFETSGAWLFRWRSYLPGLLFGLILIGTLDFEYPAEGADHVGWALGCLAVALLGQLVRAHAIGHAGLGTSGRVTSKQEADELNTTGLYSALRHPLYLGNYLMWLGAALLTGTVWIPLVITLIFWLYYERIMVAEESFLRGKFGAAFEEWAARTPAFVPSFRNWRPPAHRFNLMRVLRRERTTVLALVMTFAAFDFIVGTLARDALHIDRIWLVLIGVTMVYYLIMHVEKRAMRARARNAAG
jgi:protein-S-isoprenylcysteine O-methyltransferase Ste14